MYNYRLIFLLIFSSQILVTNDDNSSISATVHNKPNDVVQKRKLRRVGSLIKSSIEKLTSEKQQEQNTKKASTNTSIDKRPFPFGHW